MLKVKYHKLLMFKIEKPNSFNRTQHSPAHFSSPSQPSFLRYSLNLQHFIDKDGSWKHSGVIYVVYRKSWLE